MSVIPRRMTRAIRARRRKKHPCQDPIVISQIPFPGETGLSVIRGASIQFDRDVALVDFVVGKIVGPGPGGFDPLTGTASYDPVTHTASFAAVPGATAGGLYEAECTVQGCKESSFNWLFQIGPAPGPGPLPFPGPGRRRRRRR